MGRFGATLADSAPVVILAAIAAAGSFTHIRDTAAKHGQRGAMAWAIAVCIDLTCVMAARERQRDRRTKRHTARLSWPTLVLVGGVLLSLAANLDQAQPNPWGWITAATPAAAFLLAVSMLERRANTNRAASPAAVPLAVPESFGAPARPVQDERPEITPPPPSPAATRTVHPLLDFARRVAAEHQTKHGQAITRDALRARLGVSNQLASDLLRQVRNQTA